MKRVAPVLLAVTMLAVMKKKAMRFAGHHHSHEERRQRFEERARQWHAREHERLDDDTSGASTPTDEPQPI